MMKRHRARPSRIAALILAMAVAHAAAATGAQAPRVVLLGDSITAGSGLAAAEAYPAVLEAWALSAGWDVEIITSARAGDTAADALARIDAVLRLRPDVLVVALGGNDALEGNDVRAMATSLTGIIQRGQQAGAQIMLAGMEAPPEYGPAYTRAFRSVFSYLGNRREIVFMPFLLEGVARVSYLNQADGIHPNAAGAYVIAENLWPYIDSALRLHARRNR